MTQKRRNLSDLQENELPDKLTDLMALALWDLQIIEKTPGITIDMGSWMEYEGANKCKVCMAGSTLYNKGVQHASIDPLMIQDSPLRNKLEILDILRQICEKDDRKTIGPVSALVTELTINMYMNLVMDYLQSKGLCLTIDAQKDVRQSIWQAYVEMEENEYNNDPEAFKENWNLLYEAFKECEV